MPEYVVFAELHILGKAVIEAESLEEAQEDALHLDPYEFQYEYDDVDSAEPIAVYEANEYGCANYSRPHLERLEEEVAAVWRRKENGI